MSNTDGPKTSQNKGKKRPAVVEMLNSKKATTTYKSVTTSPELLRRSSEYKLAVWCDTPADATKVAKEMNERIASGRPKVSQDPDNPQSGHQDSPLPKPEKAGAEVEQNSDVTVEKPGKPTAPVDPDAAHKKDFAKLWSAKLADLSNGDYVTHPQNGPGKVTYVGSGPRGNKVSVAFDWNPGQSLLGPAIMNPTELTKVDEVTYQAEYDSLTEGLKSSKVLPADAAEDRRAFITSQLVEQVKEGNQHLEHSQLGAVLRNVKTKFEAMEDADLEEAFQANAGQIGRIILAKARKTVNDLASDDHTVRLKAWITGDNKASAALEAAPSAQGLRRRVESLAKDGHAVAASVDLTRVDYRRLWRELRPAA